MSYWTNANFLGHLFKNHIIQINITKLQQVFWNLFDLHKEHSYLKTDLINIYINIAEKKKRTVHTGYEKCGQ